MRFVFDTSVLIDYVRGDDVAADALVIATQQGAVLVSLITFMELWLPVDRKRSEIQQEIDALKNLCENLGIRIVPCTRRAQELAVRLLERHRTPLGRNALPDSLIIATACTCRACLVTQDKAWGRVAESAAQKLGARYAVRVMTPEQLLEGS